MSKRASNPARDVAEGVAVEPSAPPHMNAETINIYNGTVNNHVHHHEKVIVKRARLTPGIVDGVLTNDGHAPREWVCDRKATPQTNVTHVGWFKRAKKWMVQKVDETGKKVYVGYASTLAQACERRRGVVDGKIGPGELVLDPKTGCWGVTKCAHCCKPGPLASFAPAPCGHNARRYAAFVRAGDDLHSGDPERVARGKKALAKVGLQNTSDGALRASWCRRCRAAMHKSDTEGDGTTALCYKMAQTIRAAMAARGCAICTERRGECLEADHGAREGHEKSADKEAGVTDVSYWVDKYGPDGPAMMRREYEQRIDRVLCKCCHFREPTHDGARGADSTTLPKGSQQRRERERVEEKTAYVNRLKREHVNSPGDEPGSCFHCGTEMMCVHTYERAFQWMHNDPLTKGCGVSELVSNRMPLKTAKPLIDAEIAKCRLGCANCHFFFETLPAMQIDHAAWDALEARWICKSARYS